MGFVLEVLDAGKTYTEQKNFDCNHAVINKFVHGSLKQQVKHGTSVAWVLLDCGHNDRFVGFFTLMMAQTDQSLLTPLGGKSLPGQVPCTRLVMLGVDSRYKGQDLGLRLLKHAISETKIAANGLGCRGVYLDADPHAVGFYRKYGFQVLQAPISVKDPTPMFLFRESFF